MKSFSLLFNLEKKLFKNKVKSIITSPKRILSYLLYIAFMVWIIYVNIRNFGGSSNGSMMLKYASGGVYLMLFFMGYALTKKSSIYFQMSEINLLFSAPIDPRKLLMFTLLKKIPVYLFTSIFSLLFIFSMIIGVFNPTPAEIAITCIGYTMVMLILEPLGFCIFAITTRIKKPELSETIPKIVFAVLGLVSVVFVGLTLKDTGFSIEAIFAGIGHEALNYVPIIGWGKALTLTSLTGITSMTYVYLGLMFGMYLLLVLMTYVLGTDYYEDVIFSSEERHIMVKEARKGKIQFKGFQLKKKAIKIKDKYRFSGAVHWKKKLLTTKSDISVYLSIESLLAIVAGIAAVFLLKEEKIYGPYIVAGIYFYVKFLFSMNTSLDKELNMHYFYTIPDSAFMKLINVTKVDVIRFFTTIVLLVVSNIIAGQQFELGYVILPFATTMFYAMMLLSSFTLKLFFSAEDFNRLMIMFKMLQMVVILLPSIVVMITIGVITESILFALLGSLAVNIIAASVFLGLSDVIFNRLELK